MASNEEQPKTEEKMFGEADRPLSKVSTQYDVGDKGFLTDTEKQMRGMDSDNLGHLTNAQVSSVVTETLALRETTDRMKTWLGILGVFAVILAISNLGTAFAAAWLAKDTTVNESTGKLLVKDSDTPVMVQSYGQTSSLVLEESSSYGCMDREEAAKLWTGVLDGTASALTIQESSEMDADVDPSVQAFFALVLTTNGATWNDTMACMPVSNDSGDKVCVDFTDHRCDAGHTDRALEVVDHHTRRQLFHEAAQGHRALAHEVKADGTVVTHGTLTNMGGVALSGDVSVELYRDSYSNTGTIVLGTAGNFAILAKSGITTVPASIIWGNIGVSPISAAAMTGFSNVMDTTNEWSESGQVRSSNGTTAGQIFAPNYALPTPTDLTTAVLNMGTAFTNAAGRTNPNAARKELGAGILGGDFGGPSFPLTAGVYTFTTSVSIKNDLWFDGKVLKHGTGPGTANAPVYLENRESIFIIQIAGNLKMDANYGVYLRNGAQAQNIFYQISGLVEVGAGAHLEGNLLVATSVTFITLSSLYGRVLSQTAVNLQMATIKVPDDPLDSHGATAVPAFIASPGTPFTKNGSCVRYVPTSPC
jgi:hypothetical protein